MHNSLKRFQKDERWSHETFHVHIGCAASQSVEGWMIQFSEPRKAPVESSSRGNASYQDHVSSVSTWCFSCAWAHLIIVFASILWIDLRQNILVVLPGIWFEILASKNRNTPSWLGQIFTCYLQYPKFQMPECLDILFLRETPYQAPLLCNDSTVRLELRELVDKNSTQTPTIEIAITVNTYLHISVIPRL